MLIQMLASIALPSHFFWKLECKKPLASQLEDYETGIDISCKEENTHSSLHSQKPLEEGLLQEGSKDNIVKPLL